MSAELHAYQPAPWMAKANCHGKPTRWWYSTDRGDQARARAYCDPCPVRLDCLATAMQREEPGIWGGLNLQERQNLQRQARPVKVLVCPHCKTRFERPATARGWAAYCSRRCTKRASYERNRGS